MVYDKSEERRRQAIEYIAENQTTKLGLLSIALQNIENYQEKEVEKDMKLYRKLANEEFGMSFMELYFLDNISKHLKPEDRKNFLANPGSFIPNFRVFREFGAVLEEYSLEELRRLDLSINVSKEEIDLMMPATKPYRPSRIEQKVVKQLPQNANNLKKIIYPILTASANRSLTSVSSENFRVADVRPAFHVALPGAVAETLFASGSSEIFIRKFTIPGTTRKLTRHYLQQRARAR